MSSIQTRKQAAIEAEGRFAAAHFASSGVTQDTIFALLDRYGGMYEAMGEVMLPKPGGGSVKAACSKGCWFCCHTIIILTAPEAFYLAAFIERTRTPEALAALKARIFETDRTTRGLAGDQRWGSGPPCPLLDQASGACGVYGGRPLACRGAYSSSLDACKKAFATRAANPRNEGAEAFIYQNADVVTFALAIGMKSTGRDLYKLELIAALVEIWSREDAFKEWLAGVDVFEKARAPNATTPLI
jgi:hypothetical protein